MTTQYDDMGDYEDAAPRPVDASSVEQGSFERIGEGQGAMRAQPRDADATDSKPLDKRLVAALGAGALVVIALVCVMVVRALDAPASGSADGEPEGAVQAATQAVEVPEGGVAFGGAVFELTQGEKGFELTETSAGGEGRQVSVGELDGVPVCLVTYDNALVIPQNLDDGTWNVVAYTPGSGWSPLMDQAGAAQEGTGSILEATLDGATLHLAVDGANHDIPLSW